MEDIKQYSVDELNNMQLEEMKVIERIIWKYYKKVTAVISFTEALDREDENE